MRSICSIRTMRRPEKGERRWRASANTVERHSRRSWMSDARPAAPSLDRLLYLCRRSREKSTEPPSTSLPEKTLARPSTPLLPAEYKALARVQSRPTCPVPRQRRRSRNPMWRLWGCPLLGGCEPVGAQSGERSCSPPGRSAQYDWRMAISGESLRLCLIRLSGEWGLVRGERRPV